MKTLGAIDVGTNTIKLLVAAVEEDGALEVIAREKELVRLGTATMRSGFLSEEAMEAGVSAVERLAREARSAGAETVLAVGTCALREARNGGEFVETVRQRTGLSLEIISGEEEARLINLAARSEYPAGFDPLFLLDIGGGSTELVVSRGSRVLFAESIPVGVVRLAERFSRHDPPTKEDRRAMKRAIRSAARKAVDQVRRAGFKTCVGSSGTIQSLSCVHESAIRGREAASPGHRTLDRAGLRKVNRILRRTTLRQKLRVPGLDPRRRDLAVPGGLLLSWILKNAGAEAIIVGERGLREGVLLDHVARQGRMRFGAANRDVRARSVDRLLRRANASSAHTARVARLALQLFDETHALHQLAGVEREWLNFGALLHDVGRSVGFSRHHQHSYYLISQAGLTGFASEEVDVIASIARYHKGEGPKKSHENWRSLDPYLRPVVEKLAALVRIAEGLDRTNRQIIENVTARVRSNRVDFELTAREDCEAELTAARKKANLFERVFRRKAVFRAVAVEQAEAIHQRNLDLLSAEALWGRPGQGEGLA